ncbi:hypothetical protein QJS10_CPB19g01253 [Acorus calamus]|uniref:Leucine-rich repeat-containing N-terminal plant-type domain-containing protein n=1 Tax=Acorus calamus TaxID=4465 RepID=A0AAV9CHE6_ACOCL|nr:hypothetical protein QJS10_CPB19g01253 [Acorus calamus]
MGTFVIEPQREWNCGGAGGALHSRAFGRTTSVSDGDKGFLHFDDTWTVQIEPRYDPTVLIDWVVGGGDCCNWTGVECDAYRAVSIIDLSYVRLGFSQEWYPNASLFGQFTELKELYLRDNYIAEWVNHKRYVGFQHHFSKFTRLIKHSNKRFLRIRDIHADNCSDRSIDLCRPSETYFDWASVDTYSDSSTDLCRPSEEDFDWTLSN